jgi:Cys-tRNA(Pro) deacylase
VDAARALGLEIEPREYDEHTRTAEDAARTIGVTVGQIVKSLVFLVDEEAVLALVSGDNLLDESKLATAAGGRDVNRPDANKVRDVTGYPVGGVPPLGHNETLRVFIDRDLLGYDEVWAAAGTPHCNFPVAPDDLVRATGGAVVDLARATSRPGG